MKNSEKLKEIGEIKKRNKEDMILGKNIKKECVIIKGNEISKLWKSKEEETMSQKEEADRTNYSVIHMHLNRSERKLLTFTMFKIRLRIPSQSASSLLVFALHHVCVSVNVDGFPEPKQRDQTQPRARAVR